MGNAEAFESTKVVAVEAEYAAEVVTSPMALAAAAV